MQGKNMQIKLKYVIEDVDRHGNVRVYFRRNGRKLRLPTPIGSPEFLRAYRDAKADKQPRAKRTAKVGAIKPKSFRFLCTEYFKSGMYLELDPRTRQVRRGIIDRFCQNQNDGDKPYADLQPKHMRLRRDAMMDRPEAANNMLKAVRQVYKFAVRYDFHDRNPVEGVEKVHNNSDGYHSWSRSEIDKFEQVHPIGTQARLALALALYTAQRRADIIQFGKQHIRDEWLIFTQFKNRNHSPVRLEVPIIPELRKIIDATPCGELTFLQTAFNKPFTSNGFGNRFRKWCDEAGLGHCSVHGLRKAAASRLAELGCTEQEIMAITGHKNSHEVTRYTKAASQKIRAESALKRMTGEHK